MLGLKLNHVSKRGPRRVTKYIVSFLLPWRWPYYSYCKSQEVYKQLIISCFVMVRYYLFTRAFHDLLYWHWNSMNYINPLKQHGGDWRYVSQKNKMKWYRQFIPKHSGAHVHTDFDKYSAVVYQDCIIMYKYVDAFIISLRMVPGLLRIFHLTIHFG